VPRMPLNPAWLQVPDIAHGNDANATARAGSPRISSKTLNRKAALRLPVLLDRP
jgi:hypothetical protein